MRANGQSGAKRGRKISSKLHTLPIKRFCSNPEGFNSGSEEFQSPMLRAIKRRTMLTISESQNNPEGVSDAQNSNAQLSVNPESGLKGKEQANEADSNQLKADLSANHGSLPLDLNSSPQYTSNRTSLLALNIKKTSISKSSRQNGAVFKKAEDSTDYSNDQSSFKKSGGAGTDDAKLSADAKCGKGVSMQELKDPKGEQRPVSQVTKEPKNLFNKTTEGGNKPPASIAPGPNKLCVKRTKLRRKSDASRFNHNKGKQSHAL